MESDGAATGPQGPRFRWRGHAARNLLLHLFCCQRTENWLYEGRAVETSSVYRCSSTLAAVDTTYLKIQGSVLYVMDTTSRAIRGPAAHPRGPHAAPRGAARCNSLARPEEVSNGHAAYLCRRCRGRTRPAARGNPAHGSPRRLPACRRHYGPRCERR